MTDLLQVPSSVQDRLTSFYGCQVKVWLAQVSLLLQAAADKWGVQMTSVHDRGWTSVVAFGYTVAGGSVILKAVPDRERYLREVAALQHWDGNGAAEILGSCDRAQVLCLRAVGGMAGGATRPSDHELRVAARLPVLHATVAGQRRGVPDVASLFRSRIGPRLRRSRLLRDRIGRSLVERTVEDLDSIMNVSRPVMLHADLYAENVLFEQSGQPVFIDPRGLVGSAAYDWAFWCVFYADDGVSRRIAITDEECPVDRGAVRRWAAVLAADALCHELRAGDYEAVERLQALLSTGVLLGDR